MRARVRLLMVMLAVLALLAGCAGGGEDDTNGDDARLAFGLHELADGTVVGLGVLEWAELEGGFYALTGDPEDGGTIAVIANPDDFEDELTQLLGATVQVTGTLSEGASIRQAGPEIVIDSVAEITDTPGPED